MQCWGDNHHISLSFFSCFQVSLDNANRLFLLGFCIWVCFDCFGLSWGGDILCSFLHVSELDEARMPFNKLCHSVGILPRPLF